SDPLTDIQRAIVDSCPFRFVNREKLYGLAVRQTDVLEIENQSTAFFLFQQAPKRVHVVPCNPTTDAQEHTMFSDYPSMDSEGHCARPSGTVAAVASTESNPPATRNLRKAKRRTDNLRRRRSRKFRKFRKFRNLEAASVCARMAT